MLPFRQKTTAAIGGGSGGHPRPLTGSTGRILPRLSFLLRAIRRLDVARTRKKAGQAGLGSF